jgi:uncharacterized protein (TIGR03382 family)
MINMGTFIGVVIVLAVVGFAVYWFGRRRGK